MEWRLPSRFDEGYGLALETIEQTIIPFIEREYRADPSHRVLAGASLGGLFTLYSMYSKPELFHGWIAVTPAVVVGNDWLLDYEKKFAEAGVQPDQVITMDFASIKVPGTPTVLHVDNNGKVLDVWVGKLDAGGERQVLKAL